MSEAEQFLSEGYSLKSSINFKKGKFSLFANLVGLVVILAGFVITLLLFDHSAIDISELLIKLLIFFVIVVAFLLINPCIQIVFFKIGGGGKIKFHFGLMLEVYCENPIKRNNYFLAQLFSNIIPLVALGAFTIFFWSDVIFLSLIFVASNFLAYIPLYVFVLKHDKNSLARFSGGVLNIYAKTLQ